ncbi:MAG TPA: carboxypeptidase-like regulatory domain-containing protein, partial [Kofleriaceae bacterium]
QIAHLATMAAGQFWAAVTDIKDNLGNQVLNAFATDWCDDDATDSDKWKQTTDANAVSPQNLMFYDSPLYGYSEPLIYRDERMEEVTIYKWRLVKQTGTVTGHVRFNGNPVAGGDVQISAAMQTHTDGNGKFTIANVPVGEVIVAAQTEIDNLRMSAAPPVQVTANHTTDLTIDLAAPSHVFRRIVIDGSLNVTDYEFAAAAYPHNHSDFNGLADLDPGTATHVTKTFDCVCDDDTLGRLFLTFDLQPDDSVIVKTTIRCYDSNKADTDDYDEGELDPFTLAPGGHSHWTIFVDGDNAAEAYFHVENTVNPS